MFLVFELVSDPLNEERRKFNFVHSERIPITFQTNFVPTLFHNQKNHYFVEKILLHTFTYKNTKIEIILNFHFIFNI